MAFEIMKKSCGVCGGKMVKIRGKYPKDLQREVCPMCLAERMDMIRKMADKQYGVAFQDYEHPEAPPKQLDLFLKT